MVEEVVELHAVLQFQSLPACEARQVKILDEGKVLKMSAGAAKRISTQCPAKWSVD